MDAAATLFEPDADQPLLPRQIERLDRLADVGLELAQALLAQAKGKGPKVVEGDLALAYDRIARAVRMATMLQSRLVEDARRSHETPAEAPPLSPAVARKDQVARIVKRIAQGDDRLDGYQIGWAGREARERLEHDDVYGQVMSRPVSDLVADICRDIGLNPHWARLAREAWAGEEMASGVVGECLQQYMEGAASPARGRGGPRSGGEGADGANPAPVPIPTLDDRVQALAYDPGVVAAGRSESG